MTIDIDTTLEGQPEEIPAVAIAEWWQAIGSDQEEPEHWTAVSILIERERVAVLHNERRRIARGLPDLALAEPDAERVLSLVNEPFPEEPKRG